MQIWLFFSIDLIRQIFWSVRYMTLLSRSAIFSFMVFMAEFFWAIFALDFKSRLTKLIHIVNFFAISHYCYHSLSRQDWPNVMYSNPDLIINVLEWIYWIMTTYLIWFEFVCFGCESTTTTHHHTHWQGWQGSQGLTILPIWMPRAVVPTRLFLVVSQQKLK